MDTSMTPRRRGAPGLKITSLPYEVRVYLNNQVLIPASLVRALGLRNARAVRVTLEYGGEEFSLEARLLRTRYTDSRQFTIPRSIREKYGVFPGAVVKVKKIEPLE
ncbi:MAG: AbrB/MazE/SpoVT family DNA-binding domain-containing protein [Thermoprotei archaeon]|nr:MAG: AbrB/MazE/SpoVT family DNA-binding domain-containing protein [Thermoprotei archaeon]